MPPDHEKPIIGIIAKSREEAGTLAEVVERSDGHPQVILAGDGLPPEEVLTEIEGLIICGQGDVAPSPGQNPLEAAADQGLGDELSLLKAALEVDLPVLCTGAGMHALNVAMGGTLTSDVPGHAFDEGGDETSSYHHIFITPGSKLAAVVGSGGFVRVNSRHHRGVREAQKSSSLMASAYSLEDGVIEALESPEHRWVLAVQFHPERRREIPPHFDRLFQALVATAKERVKARKSP